MGRAGRQERLDAVPERVGDSPPIVMGGGRRFRADRGRVQSGSSWGDSQPKEVLRLSTEIGSTDWCAKEVTLSGWSNQGMEAWNYTPQNLSEQQRLRALELKPQGAA